MNFTPETTKKLREWLKENNFEVGCRLGKEVAFQPADDFNNSHIIIPKTYDFSLDKFFIEFLKKYGYSDNFEAITLSFLHEIGHFETKHLFNQEEWNTDAFLKMSLGLKNNETQEEEKEIVFKYWETSTEFCANMWLIMYTQIFKEKVVKLEKILKKYSQ